MPYNNSRIILIKIATYYSQNYAGILGSGLSYDSGAFLQSIIIGNFKSIIGTCLPYVMYTMTFVTGSAKTLHVSMQILINF